MSLVFYIDREVALSLFMLRAMTAGVLVIWKIRVDYAGAALSAYGGIIRRIIV